MPTYKKHFSHKFMLNGVELENVSIGASAIGKFEEPLDEAGLHLPFTIRDYEYPMRGLLEVISEDYKGNVIETFYLVLSDEVEEGSKYGEWKHNLHVMEYSGKYDAYLYHTFTYTKALKNNNPAPFEVLNDLNNAGSTTSRTFSVYKMVFMDPLDVKTTYYSDENITFPQVNQGVQGTTFISSSEREFSNVDVYISIDGSTNHILSNNDYTFTLSAGEHFIDYGIMPVINEVILTDNPLPMYRFYVNAIPRNELSVLDALNIIRDSKPFESKLYHADTRLFNIDANIENYLASVEMPQMFLQKATMRQILNTIFSYVNAISRFTYNKEGIDTLSMDEFNKRIGSFDIQDIVAYHSKQEAVNLFNQGITWGERVLPTSFEEGTITSPAENLYKTVRSTQVQLVDTKFGIPLDGELYQPVELKTLVSELDIISFVTNEHQTTTNLPLDLTARLINREEWYLKNVTVDFPEPYINSAYSTNVGLRENRVSNLYWTQGSNEINLSEVVGETLQTNIIFSTIEETINEYITRNGFQPKYSTVGANTYLITRYEVNYDIPATTNYRNLQFLFKYITIENMTFQTHRENIENSPYYSEGRLNQTDKALNISFASMRAHGDTQRSGVPNITFTKYYDDYDNILRWGMIDDNDYVIVEEKFEYHNEYVKATYVASKDHNRLSLWTKVDQEYRWTEIPRTNQVFERHELFNENILVTNPNTTVTEENTMITQNALNLMFGTLMNDWDNTNTFGKTKVTLAYVRTDGFLEVYPDDLTYRYLVLTPVRSFGGKHGFTFLFGFDGNQVAGNAIEAVSGLTTTYWNKAVRYTNERGEFTQMWFALETKFTLDTVDGYSLESDKNANYPLSRIVKPNEMPIDAYATTHIAGDMDFTSQGNNALMFGKKDKSQSIKVSIQNSILVNDYKEYVFGLPFYSNNFIVNNPEEEFGTTVGTPMYLYLYTNGTTYGKFDLYKVKSGYASSTLLDSSINASFTSNQFRFGGSISLTGVTSWAIGDSLGNLYLACNYGYNGFNVFRLHFYPNQQVIGSEKYNDGYIVVDLLSNIALLDEIEIIPFVFPVVNLDDTLGLTSIVVEIRSTDYVVNLLSPLALSDDIVLTKSEDFVVNLNDILGVSSTIVAIRSTDYVDNLTSPLALADSITLSQFIFPIVNLTDTMSLTSTISENRNPTNWVYLGSTTMAYDLAVTHTSAGSECATSITIDTWLESTYPASNYTYGYVVRVRNANENLTPCTPTFLYYFATS